MADLINVMQPALGEQELAAVREVFESNWIGRGARTNEFEAGFARHIGIERDLVTTTNSCTEATFIAMDLAGIGAGDDVVAPTVSFVGVGNAICAHGARPVFSDVDPRTLNPTAADIEAVLTPNTKAVVILHYGGYPGDVVAIADLCRDRGILLIEDAAVAVASSVDGKACGTFGDMAVWSFDHGKTLSTVDGGMLYVRDPELAARAPKMAYFGLEQVSGYDQALRAKTRWWEFDVSSFSRRSVTNDVLAAIGNVQLSRLPGFIARRKEIAEAYDEGLAGVSGLFTPPALPAGHVASYYMYWVQVEGGIRDALARDLYERGIYTTFRYPLLHKVPAYGADVLLPNAEAAAARTLLLPMHQALSDNDVSRVIEAVRECVPARLADETRKAS
jgi:aminotransferase